MILTEFRHNEHSHRQPSHHGHQRPEARPGCGRQGKVIHKHYEPMKAVALFHSPQLFEILEVISFGF